MTKCLRIIVALTLLFGGTQAFTVGRTKEALNLKSQGANTASVSSMTPWSVGRQLSKATQILATSAGGDDEEYSIDPSNIPFAALWAALLAFAFFIAPGELQGSAYDQSIIEAILANPQKPDVNELFVFVFNQFAVLPLALACVALPQASKKGPPPTPFLIAASFLGYFLFGPYMFLRGSPKEATRLGDVGWFTTNVFENKLFNIGALALSLYFATQVSWSDFGTTSQGFVDMWNVSKFVSVSSVDLSVLTLTTAALIPQDYRIRNPKDDGQANLIAASTLLLPVYGALIYCVLRPTLPEE
ncbi:hypothetical protein MHU86_23496 [Fragilaria crotonensis]|nr:hypothetical protein MHU86_23496 [Fragilaria crotonensis]